MSRRSRWGAFALALVVVGAVLLLERFGPAPSAGPEPAVASTAADPVAGSWVCAVGDGRDATIVDTLVARPSVGSGPASVELVGISEGQAELATLPALFPPSHVAERLDVAADDVATWVRWSGAPASASREWRWEDVEGLPDATVAGPCAQPFSSQWTIPGMTTAGGHEARLRLANPFQTDATVAIHFVTPEGVRAPIALQNWTVPARTVREINVNDVLPEEDDLAAVVEVAAGRLAVEGFQITRAAIGGVDGGSLLAAAPDAAETWTVPWVRDDELTTSWLWIVNTGDRTAPVELSLHTPGGGDVPQGLAELSVPPGELRRVDLSGTLPEGASSAAVTVRSDGAPVVVSAATRVTAPVEEEPDEPELDELDGDEDEEEPLDPDALDLETLEELDVAVTTDAASTGFAVQLGIPALDTSWSVSGGAIAGREEWLRLVNPSGVDAVVDVTVFDGSQALEPDGLQGITVGAGQAISVLVSDHLGDVAAWTAFVTATQGELAVGRVGQGGPEARHLVAVPGIPASAATPSGELLAGVETHGLVHRLGTALGLDAADPFGTAPRPVPVSPVPELDGFLDLDDDPQDLGEVDPGDDPGEPGADDGELGDEGSEEVP